jgi:hypothetical protein
MIVTQRTFSTDVLKEHRINKPIESTAELIKSYNTSVRTPEG